MSKVTSHPEVLIVGAGPGGISAALRLARAGVRVLVLEGAEFAGAENWSGCVYHADDLLRADVLGADLWCDAPKERRIVARSLLFHDGVTAAGFEARAHADNDFGEAWTVLRPKLDRWLAARAIDFGATLLPATTVTGLRYADGRVVGVHTDRGNIDAEVVFLAEGDAAGLLAREGLEQVAQPHYAQGIKAVLQLPPTEIERRFGLTADTGVAQEWILKNGERHGRPVTLNATAFLYTNRDSLSLGLVLPLAQLASEGVSAHAQLFQRVLSLPGIAAYVAGATQVAYGAKIIRAGGAAETPVWVRDGLAVGGGALSLGMEFPYPNFIGPAITSGLAFADAVVRTRERARDYSAATLEREYAARLRDTADYANSELLKRWPAALHRDGLVFAEMPALLGQLGDAPAAPRAWARLYGAGRRLHGQIGALAHGLTLRGAKSTTPPLAVEFLRLDAAGMRAVAPPAALQPLARALGHFYGRRQRDMRLRATAAWRALRHGGLPLLAFGTRTAGSAARGALQFAGDLAAYKWRRVPLREFLRRPYHAHAALSTQALTWPAPAPALSATPWLAPMDRRVPDPRHIFLPAALPPATAQALANVCPAEVYLPQSRFGGVASQHENCIKCESCRVTVPGIDWNRRSAHRLSYRVPGDARRGLDGSVDSTITAALDSPLALAPAEIAAWQQLYRSLRARPAEVGDEWRALWLRLLARVPAGAAGALAPRLGAWCEQGRFGWMEAEVRSLLAQADAVPADIVAFEPHAHAYREQRRRAAWASLRATFDNARLRALAQGGWDAPTRQAFHAWFTQARAGGEQAPTEAVLTWLATWSPALAWIGANHALAEYRARGVLADLAAPLTALADGASEWLPGAVIQLVAADGSLHPLPAAVAHGAGLDPAKPIRVRAPASAGALPINDASARMSAAIALGLCRGLRIRAREYALARVQFRGDIKDAAGNDGIIKFGAIKAMLAGIEQAVRALELALAAPEIDPAELFALVYARAGVRMDAVPWLAGQIFGGMAYSEEDILAPRYRDAMVLAHWPATARGSTATAHAAAVHLFDAAVPGAATPLPQALSVFTRTRLALPEIGADDFGQAAAATGMPVGVRSGGRPRALIWQRGQQFAYRSGGFLNGHWLRGENVLTPEHFLRDPTLRATRAAVLRLLRSGFKSPTRGEPYGRYIDDLHGIPAADIERLRTFNAFATVVPRALGGKGWGKADYAVLNTLTMGHGDTSLGLLIMASTSIGTMPVLLGLDYDLPKLGHELAANLRANDAWAALEADLDALARLLERPEPAALKARLTAFGTRVQKGFMQPGSALKYIARDFLLATQRLIETAKRRDLEALATQVVHCRQALPELRERLRDEQSALPLRQAAHERFLRFLATGQISAFALTEPAAGSDTGGIQTRAVLRTVPASPDSDGFYRFTPHGGDTPQILLDAQRLVFDARRVRYRLADGSLGALDDSGWDMPQNRGERRIVTPSRRFIFHDIGTVQKRAGGFVYAYWEVTGNKMWITNGAVADRYSLYVQTDGGETGLMVERRSAGLRIGPNENKLGQRASPTNELTLARVRVSADQVIGYQGHGQVNALETLSVGRGGLVTGCATLVARLLHDYAEWDVHPALKRAAEFERTRLQTLAARLAGLMDGADLRRGDFRIEAALSKYLASEGLHRVFLWLEDIRGPQACAREDNIEKWRRDARILNIYEGTNEVQRFLVLKDLPQLLQGFSAGKQAATVENIALDAALHDFRAFVTPYVQALGPRLWQDPDLQARWFPVVDWAGELYVWTALYERTRVLETHADPVDRSTIRGLHAAMAAVARHCERLAQHIKAEFAANEREEDPVRAVMAIARAAIAPMAETAIDAAANHTGELDKDRYAGPRAIAPQAGDWCAILRSRAEWRDGAWQWAGWHAADRAVLDRLLRWRDAAPALRVQVVAIVPPGLADHLRRLQALDVGVTALEAPLAALDVAAAATAIRARIPADARLACGRRGGDADDERFALDLAARLDARIAQPQAWGSARAGHRGDWFADAAGRRHFVARARRVLLTWDLAADGRSDAFAITAWLRALQTPLPAIVSIAPLADAAVPAQAAKVANLPSMFADASALAAWLRAQFGGGAGRGPAARTFAASGVPVRDALWVAPADALARGDCAPVARAFAALGLDGYVVAALAGDDDARSDSSVQPSGEGFTLAQSLAVEGLAGVVRVALPANADRAQAARALIAAVGAPRYIALAARDAAWAATFAAALDCPLLGPITGIDMAVATVVQNGAEFRQAIPPHAVLLIADDFTGAAAPARQTPVPLAQLDLAVPARAFARWQAGAGTRADDLTRAPLVVDVGLGIGDGDRFKSLVLPLQAALASLSAQPVAIGATRKVTQELKLLPASAQIGQTGVAVAPTLLFALGVSGAPQHLNWIGKNTVAIAINRDAGAPIFRWQAENGAPHIVRCVGDLDEWVPALIAALRAPAVAEMPRAAEGRV